MMMQATKQQKNFYSSSNLDSLEATFDEYFYGPI